MRVFNLTRQPVPFHGLVIEPESSMDFPELDKYLPVEDKKLEEQDILSFGFVPAWFRERQKE